MVKIADGPLGALLDQARAALTPGTQGNVSSPATPPANMKPASAAQMAALVDAQSYAPGFVNLESWLREPKGTDATALAKRLSEHVRVLLENPPAADAYATSVSSGRIPAGSMQKLAEMLKSKLTKMMGMMAPHVVLRMGFSGFVIPPATQAVAQHRQAIGEFLLAGMPDLKATLSQVDVNGELARYGLTCTPEQAKLLEPVVEKSAARVAQLIQDFATLLAGDKKLDQPAITGFIKALLDDVEAGLAFIEKTKADVAKAS